MSRNTETLTMSYVTARTGAELEFTFPAMFVACPRCRGTGAHTNPAIDGHGISRDEFDQDPDFEEAYFRGDYDVTCERCGGDRVVPCFDIDRATARQRARYALCERQARKAAEEDAADARMRWYESGCPQ